MRALCISLMVLFATIIVPVVTSLSAGQQQTPVNETFTGISMSEARTQLMNWVDRAAPGKRSEDPIFAQWAGDDGLAGVCREDLLDRLVEAFAAVDPATRKLMESTWGSGPLEDVVYDGIRDAPFYRSHVELYRARWLVQHRYFDEALAALESLTPDDVVDPAGLFFYRAICQSELLQRDAAIDSLSLLLDHTLDVPSRFRTIGTILKKELVARKEEGLEQVSQLMSDVHRHLDLGRSGERVQQREQGVIDALDKLLKELEDQKNRQDQSQGGGEGGQQNRQPGSPAGDSQIRRGSTQGRGEADRKDIKETGGWGMLDRQKEAKARELIQQQLPASYLDIISEYSRKIAE